VGADVDREDEQEKRDQPQAEPEQQARRAGFEKLGPERAHSGDSDVSSRKAASSEPAVDDELVHRDAGFGCEIPDGFGRALDGEQAVPGYFRLDPGVAETSQKIVPRAASAPAWRRPLGRSAPRRAAAPRACRGG
jgi:hypothetical protein